MPNEFRVCKSKKRKIRRLLKLYFRQKHLMIRQLKKDNEEIQARPVPKIEPLKELLLEC